MNDYLIILLFSLFFASLVFAIKKGFEFIKNNDTYKKGILLSSIGFAIVFLMIFFLIYIIIKIREFSVNKKYKTMMEFGFTIAVLSGFSFFQA